MLQSLNQNFPVKQAPLSHYDTSEAGDSNSIPWLQPFSEFHLLSRLTSICDREITLRR
jgi:hypothetical protein